MILKTLAQFEAVDFGIMPDIHREGGAEENPLNGTRLLMLLGHSQDIPLCRAFPRFRLNDQCRHLLGSIPEPNQSRTVDALNCIENSLTAVGVHGSILSHHALGDPPAKPQLASFIKVSGISHAVPDHFPRIADLGPCSCFRKHIVGLGHARASGYNFPDFALWQNLGLVNGRNISSDNPDDLYLNFRYSLSNTKTMPPSG